MSLEQTKTAEQQLEILSRGTKDFIGRDLLLKKIKSGRQLKVKAGFDPSRPDLHLGHSLLINKLRQFQELGHDVIFVVGDWTACIGDPSGQNKTRPALSFEESRKNAQSYKDQACKKNFTFRPRHVSRSGHPEGLSSQPDFNEDSEKIFNFFKRLDPKKTKIVFNSEWFEQLSLRDFVLKIASKHTLARQLERDDFKKRFKENQAIALHELFYPLLQAYDSVKLEADVEIGGTDQLFNLLLGRQLQESLGQAPQTILTLPLLKGLGAKVASQKNGYQKILTAIKTIFRKTKKGKDKTEDQNIEGADKMSKSLGNAISFNDSPKDMYGKILKLSDKLLPEWWNLFTEREYKHQKKSIFFEFLIYLKDLFIKLLSYIKSVFRSRKKRNEDKLNTTVSKKLNPKAQKEKLAWILVCSFYGEEQANKEQETFKKERTEKKIPEDMPENQDILSQGEKEQGLSLVDSLLKLNLVSSKSEARRKILEGAVRIIEDFNKILETQTIKQKNNDNISISRNQMEKITKLDRKLNIQKNPEIIISVGKRNFGRLNTWNYIHDLKVYWVYIKEKEGLGTKNKLCEELSNDEDFKKADISLKSIKMKIANYRYLDNKGGLSHVSKQSKEIYEKYKGYSIAKLEEEINKLEAEKPNKGKG